MVYMSSAGKEHNSSTAREVLLFSGSFSNRLSTSSSHVPVKAPTKAL